MQLSRRDFAAGTLGSLGALLLPSAGLADSPTVKIGYIDSFSGGTVDVASRQSVGAAMAIDEANRSGRVKFSLVTADDTSKGAEGATAARRLIEQEQVDALVVGTSSSVALSVAPIAMASGTFLMLINPQDTSLTGTRANLVTYRFAPNVSMFVNALFKRLISMGKKWYFMQADFAYGKDAYTRLSALLQENGGTEVGHDIHAIGTSDFSASLTKLKNSGADLVMLCSGGIDNQNFCKQFAGYGLQSKMKLGAMSLEDYYFRSLPMEQLTGAVFGLQWDPRLTPEAMRLSRDVLSKGLKGEPLSARHYTGYITVSQLINRMLAAGTTAVEPLAKAFNDHKFDAYKTHEAMWRACDHQCVQDSYAGVIVSAAEHAKTGYWYTIAGDSAPDLAASQCNEPDAKAASEAFASQSFVRRSGYTPKTLK